MTPHPKTIRLWTRARTSRPPAPPWGLRAWTDRGEAIAVLLDVPDGQSPTIASVAAQLPDADSLPVSSLVVLLGVAFRSGLPPWRRLLAGASPKVPRAPRCGALVARGYRNVAAGIDPATSTDLVWGYSP
jgi:hypothetical protein